MITQINKNGKVLLSGEHSERDFLFVDDFSSLVMSILNKFPDNYNLYNVGSGKSYTLKEVTHLLAKLLNRKITVDYNKSMSPGDIIKITADISKVSGAFNWEPLIDLRKGLQLSIGDSNLRTCC